MTEANVEQNSEEKKIPSKGKKKPARKSRGVRKKRARWTTVTKASLRHTRISPRKARLVVDLIKGKQVEPALQILKFSPKKGARLVAKLLHSAIVNAKEVASADVDSLWVTGGWVNAGRTMKRYMPRARGSANVIRKRAAHITIELGQRG